MRYDKAATERALAHHKATGLISGWLTRLPGGYQVTMTTGTEIELRSLREATILVQALASASQATGVTRERTAVVVLHAELPYKDDRLPDLMPRTAGKNVTDNLATLNEIAAEVVEALAGHGIGDRPFADMARELLRDHTWSLGYRFQDEPPSAAWHAQQEAKNT